MKHIAFFKEFLSEEVNLNQTRIDRLNQSVDAIEQFLSNNLDGYISTEPQGSCALGTIIKPVDSNKEYDADILITVEYDEIKTPKDYIKDLYQCLKSSSRYAEKTHRQTRCVSLEYKGDFHLDIVPCVVDKNNQIYICNYKNDLFEETDGTGYRDWFNERNSITNGNLKRVTRLLKYLRDHKKNFTAKSILLTTLIGNTVFSNDEGFENLPSALKTVSNRINSRLQDNIKMPEISNPVLPQERLDRHWDQTKYENFRRLFNIYNDRINKAYMSKNNDESIDKWRDIFGEELGEKRKESKSERTNDIVIPRKPYAR